MDKAAYIILLCIAAVAVLVSMAVSYTHLLLISLPNINVPCIFA